MLCVIWTSFLVSPYLSSYLSLNPPQSRAELENQVYVHVIYFGRDPENRREGPACGVCMMGRLYRSSKLPPSKPDGGRKTLEGGGPYDWVGWYWGSLLSSLLNITELLTQERIRENTLYWLPFPLQVAPQLHSGKTHKSPRVGRESYGLSLWSPFRNSHHRDWSKTGTNDIKRLWIKAEKPDLVTTNRKDSELTGIWTISLGKCKN